MSRYLFLGLFLLTLFQGKRAFGSDSLDQTCRPEDFGENQSLNQALEHIYQVRMGYIELSQVDPERDDQKKAFVEQSGIKESDFEELLERFGGDFYNAADELLYHLTTKHSMHSLEHRNPSNFSESKKFRDNTDSFRTDQVTEFLEKCLANGQCLKTVFSFYLYL